MANDKPQLDTAPATATPTQVRSARRGRRIAVFCVFLAIILGASTALTILSNNQVSKQQGKMSTIEANSKTMQRWMEYHGFVVLGVTNNAPLAFRAIGDVADITLVAKLKFGVCYADVKATARANEPRTITLWVYDRSTSQARWLGFPLADIKFQELLNNRTNFGLRACFLENRVQPN